MRVVYLPAIWPSALCNRWVSSPLNGMDPRLRGTTAYHPFALTSYAESGWRNQRFTWEPEDFVFGDSGGFSVATRDAHIDPRDALRWQIHRCSVGAILDAPPWLDWSQRRACLTTTIANVRAALPVYRAALDAGTAFRWWGVVHGRTADELAEWWAAISRVYPFTAEGEGWAFRPHPLNDPEAMADVLAFVRQTGIRSAHFFATSGLNAVETLYAYGADAGLVSASFDSTSALKRGFWRTLVIPTVYGWETIQERFRESGGRDTRARDYMFRVCACHSCDLLRADVRTDGDLRGDDLYVMHRMMFHNLLATLTCYDRLRQRYAPAPSHALATV
jgi:hypothetical protein